MFRAIALPVAVLLLFAATANAQTPASPSTSDSETIRELKQEIERLQQRVSALEAASQKTAASSTATPAQEASAAATPSGAGIGQPPSIGQTEDMQGLDTRNLTGQKMVLRGYSDIGYTATDSNTRTNAFALGQFNLFITSRLSQRASVLAETVVEADETNAFGIELERLLFRYSLNDRLNFTAGRYHSAIGFYNTAYHHSAYMQTAIGRPLLFQFEDEGGILPIHNVGITADGTIPSGGLGLHYVAELGNGRFGRQDIGNPVQNVVDENNGKSVNFEVFAQPDSIPGLRAGFSIYHDHLTPAGLPQTGELIPAVHVIYQDSRFEFLNEAALVRHTPEGLRTFNTPGMYTQISERFGNIRPYFRYDYINAPSQDPIIGFRGRQNGPSAGIRYDFTRSAAFKIQYSRLDQRGENPINGISFQVSFAF